MHDDATHELHGYLAQAHHDRADALLTQGVAAGFDRATLIDLLKKYAPALGSLALQVIEDIIAARKPA